jgi:DNA mismatch repair protein MutL
MGKIRILSDETASQVAAGEVVERPASIIKELVENSLDAGASRLEVEFVRGGSDYLRVSDNGCGMDREDALLCLERHATSKIRVSADLPGVRTMGFRGEALPSIASVSRFRMVTREPESPAATQVSVSGAKVEDVSEVGAPQGTTIEVKSLFYNVPARRKFLKGEQTEAAHIVQTLQVLALANPRVAFDVVRDKQSFLRLPAAAQLPVRVRDLLGKEYLSTLTEFEPVETDGIRLSGMLGKPGQGRRDRHQQYVFINGRPVSSPAVYQALREGYGETLPRGMHPPAVLNIEMDPEMVDCNVHPAKREVRLRRPDLLSRAVIMAVEQVLEQSKPGWSKAIAPQPPVAVNFVPAARQEVFVPREPLPEPQAHSLPSVPPVTEEPQAEPDRFMLMGFLREDYLVLEGEEGLVLLDVRAAGERILFETLMRQMDSGVAPSQRLLIPEVVELPVREHAWVVENLEDLRAAGILAEPFGGTTVKIEGLPSFASDIDAKAFLHDIATSLRAAGRVQPGRGARESLARAVCQVAATERLARDSERARRLVGSLLKCDLPYASPSGRPTMIQFSFSELGRKFGR